MRRKAQPCLLKTGHEDDVVNGKLLYIKHANWIHILDDFEGETHHRVSVVVQTTSDNGEKHDVNAMCYVWKHSNDPGIMKERWNFDVFVKENLETYLDIFEGMEFLGKNDQPKDNTTWSLLTW